MKREWLAMAVSAVVLAWGGVAGAAEMPKPYGPVPSARQLVWHEREMYAFVHFGINTFTDREWGYGDESPQLFNPTDFNADQIVSTVKAAGLKGLVLTCKHHDGFALWPSKYTEHSIKKSPWKGGEGDIVREISDACRRHGLAFGVYLSPWDRNHKEYGRAEYVEYFRNQLTELLTNYGPVFEVWHDGANGGDGYYGGAREKRTIDKLTYYGWPKTYELVRRLQPEACLFSDSGPDCRWVGNEEGYGGETCWQTMETEMHPGVADMGLLNRGERPGKVWLPAEADVSIRPGWFYHAREDAKVKTPEELTDIYFGSVGRGTNLILNLPPDRRGQIAEPDVRSLMAWRKHLEATFSTDLAKGAVVKASSTREGAQFAAANLVDGKRETFWCSEDGVLTPEVVVELPKAVTFSVIGLREYLPLGQRVDAVAFDRWDEAGGKWVEIATATSVGNLRLIRLPRNSPVTTQKLRLRVTKAEACPAFSELGLYLEPGK